MGFLGIFAFLQGLEGFWVENLAIASFEGVEGDLAVVMETRYEEWEIVRLGKEEASYKNWVNLADFRVMGNRQLRTRVKQPLSRYRDTHAPK